MKTHRTLELVLASAIATLLIGLFHLHGNTSNVPMEGRSIFVWVFRQWTHPQSDFSHGWVMPLISLALVWRRRHELRTVAKSGAVSGLVAVAGLLALHVAAARAQQPRLSSMIFAALTWAIPFAIYGPEVGRILLFPCAYLLLSVAAYLLVNFTFQMRLAASSAAAFMLNGLGIAAQRRGTAIFSAAGGGFNFDVADPCSGLRSLVVITALAAPYAYLTQRTTARKWLLFLGAVPLAIMANIVRIVGIALIAQFLGRAWATRVYHDYSGYIVFGTAVILMMALDRLLNAICHRIPPQPAATTGHAPGPAQLRSDHDGTSLRRLYFYWGVFGMLWLMALSMTAAGEPRPAPPLRLRLPQQVGFRRAQRVLFCQNQNCGRSFSDEQTLTRCPLCGSPLDEAAPAEKNLLPPGTRIVRRRYASIGEPPFLVSIVFSDQERRSIHRPQVCLVGQGYSIVDQQLLKVPLPSRPPLEVMVLLALKGDGAKDETSELSRRSCHAYWFVNSEGRETPYHFNRLLWTAWDAVVKNRRPAWAYLTVASACRGQLDDERRRLAAFIQELYPELQNATADGQHPIASASPDL